jgi:hypothetical protein
MNDRIVMTPDEFKIWADRHFGHGRLLPWTVRTGDRGTDKHWQVIDTDNVVWYTDGSTGAVWRPVNSTDPITGEAILLATVCTCGGQKFGGGTCSNWCDLVRTVHPIG